jgi:ribosome maturation factor RimP
VESGSGPLFRFVREGSEALSKAKVVDLVRDLAQPIVAELGLELFDVEYVKEGTDWYLRVYIDRADHEVSIDDCEAVSRVLSQELDRVDPIPGQYLLEISSPGLERPLRHQTDVAESVGKLICLTTYAPVAGKKKFEGRLLSFENEELVLQVGQSKQAIPYSQVAKARLVAEI